MNEPGAYEKKPPPLDVEADAPSGPDQPDGADIPGFDERLAACQQALGHTFASPPLLALALRHASASTRLSDNNERLEFLGDAVLDLIVAEMLYDEFPDWREGALTEVKSRAVNRTTLAHVGRTIHLDSWVVVGPGIRGGEAMPLSVIAGCLESLLGAVYLDSGLAAARDVIARLFEPILREAVRGGHDRNFKARLQEYSQSILGESPVFRITQTAGPDHGRIFQVSAYVGSKEIGQGEGRSKKEAEQDAARNALENLSSLPGS